MIYGKADEVQVPSLDLLTFLFGMLSPLALSFTPDGMTPCRHVDVCVTSCTAFFLHGPNIRRTSSPFNSNIDSMIKTTSRPEPRNRHHSSPRRTTPRPSSPQPARATSPLHLPTSCDTTMASARQARRATSSSPSRRASPPSRASSTASSPQRASTRPHPPPARPRTSRGRSPTGRASCSSAAPTSRRRRLRPRSSRGCQSTTSWS